MCDHCGCRRFAPIAELSAEHDTVLSIAWELAESPGGAPDRPVLRARLLSVLDPHVKVEEATLYPLLIEHGGLPASSVTTLEEEHEDLREAIVGDRFDRRAFYALAAHIEEEEMDLFPVAMFAFDDDQWAELAERLAAKDPAPARASARA